jgi:DNA-binding SARP family transcriptional activator/TolB-like protein
VYTAHFTRALSEGYAALIWDLLVMIRLNLLGECDVLRTNGERVHQLLQQPKRMALLAYLALADNACSLRKRDEALLLFWPDLTEKRARNALSQSVHFLRRSIGAEVVVDHGPGELGVDNTMLWCDVVAYRQAVSRGEWTEAIRLYRGDLLAGFSISAGPEFEHWLDDQRRQLRRDAAAGAWKLAEAAGANANGDQAASWARRAVDLSGNDERAVQRLLRLLLQLGDGAGALETYERFRARLSSEFDAAPTASTRAIIASIRSGEAAQPNTLRPEAQSALLRPEVAADVPADDEVGSGLAPTAATRNLQNQGGLLPVPGAGRRRSAPIALKRWMIAASVAVCALASVALHEGTRAHAVSRDRTTPEVIPYIVVDSLTDVGASQTEGLGAALTSAVLDQLVGVRAFNVVATSPRPEGRRPRTSQSSGSDFVVTGHVFHSGRRLHVDIALTDGLSGRVIKTGAFDHAIGAPLPVIDTLSREIAQLVRTTLGEEAERREWRRFAGSERAYDLVQEARDERDRAGEFEQKGNFHTALRSLGAADSLLDVAERIERRWSAPFVERGALANQLAMLYVGPLRDPARVESLLRRGIREVDRAAALNPRDPAALNTLGTLYYWYWLAVPLPPDSAARMLVRAQSSLQAAVAADPNRTGAWNLLSASLYARADYSGAYLAALRAYASDRYLQESEDMLSRLCLTAYEIRDDSASAAWCDEAQRRFPRSWTAAYCQLALLAWSHATDPKSVRALWTIAGQGAASAAEEPQAGPRLDMLVAAVLARHGLRDSAETVIRRARANDAGDDELLPLEADARIALGQPDAARALVEQYLTKKPAHRLGIAHSRRFATLRVVYRRLQ